MLRQRQKQKRQAERACALQAGSGAAPVAASGQPAQVASAGEQSDEPVTEPRRVAIFVVRALGPCCLAHVQAAPSAHACRRLSRCRRPGLTA